MELFDLEIPIRSTGGAETRAEFRRLESEATGTAARSEAALGKLVVPPQQVGAAMRKLAADTVTASDGLTKQGAVAAKAASDTTALAEAQRAAGVELQAIAGRVASAKTAFASGSLSAVEFQAALSKARSEAIALNASLGGVTRTQAPAFNAILAATTAETTTAGTAMERLALDVKQAGVAYKAGTLALDGYQVALATARAEAIALSQSGISLTARETAQFNTILTATGPASQKAVAGLGTMRSVSSTLASQLLGVKTSVGQVTGALGQMALGTGLTIGILAGVAALAAAYSALTAKSREQKAATDSLRDAWKKLNEEQNKGPAAVRAVAEKDAANLRAEIATLQKQLTAAQAQRQSATGAGELLAASVNESAIQSRLQAARRASSAAQAKLDDQDAISATESAEKRIAALTRLVAAGRATAAEQAELRKVEADTRKELAAGTDVYRKTADGIERTADLSDRLSSIQDAFNGKVREGTKELKDQVAALGARIDLQIALGNAQGFTAERITALQQAVSALDALQAKANLTDQQQLALLRARTEATEALAKATSAVIPNQGRLGLPPVPQLRPQAPAFPTSLVPSAPQLMGGFGNQQGGGPGSGIADFGKTIAQGIARARQQVATAGVGLRSSFNDLRDQLAEDIGTALGDGIAAGFSGLGGGIAQGFAQMTAALLSGLGQAMVRFGEAALITAQLMDKIKSALASFLPGGATVAAIAMIALGTALSGLGAAAAGAFGGSSGTGRQSTALAPITTTTTVGVSNTAPAQTGVRTAPSAVATAGPAPTFNFTVIGPNDPAAQRQIVKMVNLGLARGV